MKLLFLTLILMTANQIQAAFDVVINNNSGTCAYDSIAFYGSGGWLGSVSSVGTGTTTISCMTGTPTNIFFYIGANSFSIPPVTLNPVQCWMQYFLCVNEPCFNGTHWYSSTYTTGGATLPCVGDLLTITIS